MVFYKRKRRDYQFTRILDGRQYNEIDSAFFDDATAFNELDINGNKCPELNYSDHAPHICGSITGFQTVVMTPVYQFEAIKGKDYDKDKIDESILRKA